VRIQAREAANIAEKAREAQMADLNFGRTARFDSWDTPYSELPPAYAEANPLASSATTAPNRIPSIQNEPTIHTPNEEHAPSGNAPQTTESSVNRIGQGVDSELGGDAAAAGAGEDAAVGVGESVLAGLDAIPGLDLITLIAGGALAGAAAAKKRKPDAPALPPPSQSHVAFQSGYAGI